MDPRAGYLWSMIHPALGRLARRSRSAAAPARGRRRSFAAVVLVVLVVLVASVAGLTAVSAPRPAARLTWFGQSCFLLESPTGTRVVMDPLPGGLGYTPPANLRADAVTVSHEHPDHAHVALVAGRPKVLRGLTADKKGWVKIDERVKDVQIRSVGAYHDARKGAERGLNTIFVFEVGGVRIVHLGDLGHLLDDRQLRALGSVDVVLVPVGGFFTIDAQQATRVIDQLRPRLVVVPMHYKTDVLTIKELATVEAFLMGKREAVRLSRNTLDIEPWKRRPAAQVVVLSYK
jgi:L-ascorbate metabolism protein UlaG (beta-lactamase superfamily)